jgi:DNA-binding transcriptional regulator YiaG
MTPKQFKKARFKLELSARETGKAFGVDSRTVRRWEDGSQAVPGPAAQLMKLLLKRPIEAERLLR